MRLGIDVDGVLRNFVTSLINNYKADFPGHVIRPITDWGLEKFFPLGEAIYDYMYRIRPEEIFRYASLYKGAKTMMVDLQGDGHKLWVLTNQPRGTEKYTLDWLQEFGIPYDQICFVDQKHLIDCDIYLDDSP
ncbi:MAG: hypothetical protein ACE5HX_19335, partial [bacterium]